MAVPNHSRIELQSYPINKCPYVYIDQEQIGRTVTIMMRPGQNWILPERNPFQLNGANSPAVHRMDDHCHYFSMRPIHASGGDKSTW